MHCPWPIRKDFATSVKWQYPASPRCLTLICDRSCFQLIHWLSGLFPVYMEVVYSLDHLLLSSLILIWKWGPMARIVAAWSDQSELNSRWTHQTGRSVPVSSSRQFSSFSRVLMWQWCWVRSTPVSCVGSTAQQFLSQKWHQTSARTRLESSLRIVIYCTLLLLTVSSDHWD